MSTGWLQATSYKLQVVTPRCRCSSFPSFPSFPSFLSGCLNAVPYILKPYNGFAQTRLFTAIKDYSALYDVPFAKDKPDAATEYKITIDAAMNIKNPEEVYQPFEHIARMYNLHVYSGIPQKNLHVEVVVFGPSVAVLLNNEDYKKMFNVDNPNLKVIEQMEQAGIKILACGQSVMLTKADPATINPLVDIVVSRFTTVSNRQMKGYVFFKF